jgi:hypothetical protein
MRSSACPGGLTRLCAAPWADMTRLLPHSSTGLLVEEANVKNEMQRLAASLAEAQGKRELAEEGKRTVENEVDDLAASLFQQVRLRPLSSCGPRLIKVSSSWLLSPSGEFDGCDRAARAVPGRNAAQGGRGQPLGRRERRARDAAGDAGPPSRVPVAGPDLFGLD